MGLLLAPISPSPPRHCFLRLSALVRVVEMQHLDKLPAMHLPSNLRQIRLRHFDLQNTTLTWPMGLEELELDSIANIQLPCNTFDGLTSLRSLQLLKITGQRFTFCEAWLAQLANLSDLALEHIPGTTLGKTTMAAASRLQRLSISGLSYWHPNALDKVPHLEEL